MRSRDVPDTSAPPGARNDVAIYAPYAGLYYEREGGTAGGGGAELQTTFLAQSLATRGLSVAHVVYPVEEPRRLEPPAPTLVMRPFWRGKGGLGPIRETAEIWRALSAADARVVLVRGSGGHMVAAAAWCARHRRTLVFSASNDLDFDLRRSDRRGAVLRAYRLAVRQARRLVVQTEQQADLARRSFPDHEPVLIPSFAQPAEPVDGTPDYFLWIDRLTAYKRPEQYFDLAEALPHLRFRMVAVTTGETSPELGRRVSERAAALHNVELVGERSREQLLEEMSRAVAVVKTSAVEGMPNTFLEAWARAMPVLSLSVDPDARIADLGLGLLAGGSMARFTEMAQRLWAEPSLRAEIGERGRAFVRATHSPEAVAGRWSALLAGVLDEDQRGAARG